MTLAERDDVGELGDPPVLSVQELAKTYTPPNGLPKEAIRRVTFDAALGEFVCVVGPSGAGKTTLLRCLAGLMTPTGGRVAFDGRGLEGTPREVAVVFQDYSRSLFPWLTVASNIALPLKNREITKRARSELVEKSLAEVGLPDVGRYHPWQLSGGMQQRVAIARALAYQPKLLLMDEPFASVDAQTRFELEDLVLQVRERFSMTIVFVTHDIDEAVYLGDRIIVLSASPCIVKRDLCVPFGPSRSQGSTRRDPRFAELRSEVLELVMSQAEQRGGGQPR